MLIKPKMLRENDTVCTLSLSWGGAGDEDTLWRYEVGKKRLKEQFKLNVIELPSTLKGSSYVYSHPEERGRDLMRAFKDDNIKGIISCIGGNESVRILPFIDFEVIKNNPKIFLGYSDSTITHLICHKAGISSFYGPSVLAEFAENIKIFDYTADSITKTLFSNEIIGDIPCCDEWTGEIIPWEIQCAKEQKHMVKNSGYEVLLGDGVACGRLIGGCMDVLEMAKGTCIFPPLSDFEGAILFLETSEDAPAPGIFEQWLRNYGSIGVLERLSGIIFGKPYQEKYREEYRAAILKVAAEWSLNIPILSNASFGHNQPMCVLPYGALAKIDCTNKTFSILESGVI